MDEGSPASIFFPSNWQLTARDAYNGTVLWKQPIEKWVTRLFPYTIPSTKDRIDFPGGGLNRNLWVQDQPARLKAIDPVSGLVRWEVQMPIAPLCTGADAERVYLCDYKNVLALERKSGEELWATGDVNIADAYPSGYAWYQSLHKVINGKILCADTDDLNDSKSRKTGEIRHGLHYSADEYRLLGQRFADEAIRLIKKKPNKPDAGDVK